MGHGTVADEIKGRTQTPSHERTGAILGIDEDGVRFRSYVDGGERFLRHFEPAEHAQMAQWWNRVMPGAGDVADLSRPD